LGCVFVCGNDAALVVPDRIIAIVDELANSLELCAAIEQRVTRLSCEATNLCDNVNCELAPNARHIDGVCDPNSKACIAPALKADGTPRDNSGVCRGGVCTVACSGTYGPADSTDAVTASFGACSVDNVNVDNNFVFNGNIDTPSTWTNTAGRPCCSALIVSPAISSRFFCPQRWLSIGGKFLVIANTALMTMMCCHSSLLKQQKSHWYSQMR